MSFRLTILYTGGTLGMRQGASGLVPAPGLAKRFTQALQDSTLYRHRIESLSWTLVENSPLLDSANIRPEDWESIARQCRDIQDTDAIVVVHGTDTLAYSAAALAYLLCNSAVAIVLTGAQKPLGASPGDALDNLAGAMLAARDATPGVWVYFHHQMLPAARVVKKDAISFTGFEAPRLRNDILPSVEGSIAPQAKLVDWEAIHVACIHVVPGYAPAQLHALIECRPRAIILALYGRGTLADHDIQLVDALGRAAEEEIIVVAISQCYIGDIDFSIYAAGAVLQQLGVLNGGDMTLEAAYTKLMLLFRLGYTKAQVRRLFGQNIANELSPKQT